VIWGFFNELFDQSYLFSGSDMADMASVFDIKFHSVTTAQWGAECKSENEKINKFFMMPCGYSADLAALPNPLNSDLRGGWASSSSLFTGEIYRALAFCNPA